MPYNYICHLGFNGRNLEIKSNFKTSYTYVVYDLNKVGYLFCTQVPNKKKVNNCMDTFINLFFYVQLHNRQSAELLS